MTLLVNNLLNSTKSFERDTEIQNGFDYNFKAEVEGLLSFFSIKKTIS